MLSVTLVSVDNLAILVNCNTSVDHNTTESLCCVMVNTGIAHEDYNVAPMSAKIFPFCSCFGWPHPIQKTDKDWLSPTCRKLSCVFNF